MDVFYNPTGIGDVLIIPLKDADDRYNVTYETVGPVTKVLENDQTLGYNIHQASQYLELKQTGKIQLTTELLDSIKHVFETNHIQDSLDFDLSPKFVVGYVV